jgi:hypothetical protein
VLIWQTLHPFFFFLAQADSSPVDILSLIFCNYFDFGFGIQKNHLLCLYISSIIMGIVCVCPLEFVALKSDLGFWHIRSEWISFCLVRVYCCYYVTESVVGCKGVVCWSMKDDFVSALGAGHLRERELHLVVAWTPVLTNLLFGP